MNSGVTSGVDFGLQFRQASALNNITELQNLHEINPELLNLVGPKTGYAAIHQAAARGHCAAVNWLLEHNADPLLMTHSDGNAFQIALNAKHFDVLSILCNHQIGKYKSPDSFATHLDKPLKSYETSSSLEELTEQISGLQLASTSGASSSMSHAIPPAAVLSQTLEDIREQAKRRTFSFYDWSNAASFKDSLKTVLKNHFTPDQSRIKKMDEKLLKLMQEDFDKEKSSSFFMHRIGMLTKLSEIKSNPKHREKQLAEILNATDEYFEAAQKSSRDRFQRACRQIIELYKPLYEAANQGIASRDITFGLHVTIIYLIAYKDLFASGCMKGEEVDLTLDENCRLTVWLEIARLKGKSTPLLDEMLVYLIRRTQDQRYLLDKSQPLCQEYEHYIAWKNQSKVKSTLELLNVYDVSGTQTSIQALVSKALKIRSNVQSRTQFVFYANAVHAYMIDVEWDEKIESFKLIMANFDKIDNLEETVKALSREFQNIGLKSKFLIYAHPLQKDLVSCMFYALMTATHVSHLSFDELNQRSDLSVVTSETPLDAKRLPVTALGEKVILMGQSSKAMRANLIKLYGSDKKVDERLAKLKEWYAFPGMPIDGKLDYLGYRRWSLEQKIRGSRDVYSTKTILDVTQTEDLGSALRKMAAGCGPGQMLTQLLTEVSSLVINSAGGTTQKTALHWAYQFNNRGRADKLLAAGANPYLQDKNGLIPSQCRPK